MADRRSRIIISCFHKLQTPGIRELCGISISVSDPEKSLIFRGSIRKFKIDFFEPSYLIGHIFPFFINNYSFSREYTKYLRS